MWPIFLLYFLFSLNRYDYKGMYYSSTGSSTRKDFVEGKGFKIVWKIGYINVT